MTPVDVTEAMRVAAADGGKPAVLRFLRTCWACRIRGHADTLPTALATRMN